MCQASSPPLDRTACTVASNPGVEYIYLSKSRPVYIYIAVASLAALLNMPVLGIRRRPVSVRPHGQSSNFGSPVGLADRSGLYWTRLAASQIGAC